MFDVFILLYRIAVLLLPASGDFLTATTNGKIIYQREFLMQDVSACINRETHSHIYQTGGIYTCLARHISHCSHKPSRMHISHLRDLYSNSYCGNIFLQSRHVTFQHSRNFQVQFHTDFFVHVSFIIFKFEMEDTWGRHGLYLSDTASNNSVFYHGTRIPWTVIMTSNKATIKIHTVMYKVYQLHVFYSSYDMQWLSEIQNVGCFRFAAHFRYNTKSLPQTQNNYQINRFQFFLISAYLFKIGFTFSSFSVSNSSIVIYDGPGKLANILSTLNCTVTFTNLEFVASTFIAYIQIDESQSHNPPNITIDLQALEPHYPQCEIDDKNTVIAESNPHHNSACRIDRNGVLGALNMFVESYVFIGPTAFGNSPEFHFPCESGGLFIIMSTKTLRICENRADFMIYGEHVEVHAMVVWLKGYSQGLLRITIHHSECGNQFLELQNNHKFINKRPKLIDETAVCHRYICPPLLKADQKYCKFNISSHSGSLGVTKLEINLSNTIDKCIPQYHNNNREHAINISGKKHNNWPLGNIEHFEELKPIKSLPLIYLFVYLIESTISLPYVCLWYRRTEQLSLKVRYGTCRYEPKIRKKVTYSVDGVGVITPECHNTVYRVSLFTSRHLIFKEDMTRIHKGSTIAVWYGNQCPASCRNYSYVVRVLDKHRDKIYEYKSAVGDDLHVGFYHRGLRIIIIGPELPCVWQPECAIEIILFPLQYITGTSEEQTWTDRKRYQFFTKRYGLVISP